jgi:hypothetical protein
MGEIIWQKLLEIKNCKLKSTNTGKGHFTNIAANTDNWSSRDDPKGQFPIINGSLNNSRIFILENVLNHIEVERGVGEDHQRRD